MCKIYIVDGKIIKEKNLLKLKKDKGYYKRQIKICEIIEEESIELNMFLEQHKIQHDRTEQLKLILAEKEYEDLINFTNIYREIATNNITKISHLSEFKKIGLDNKKFKRYLQKYKEHFILDVSSDIEYLKAYLKINKAKYIVWNTIANSDIPPEIKENFNLAKQELYPIKNSHRTKSR